MTESTDGPLDGIALQRLLDLGGADLLTQMIAIFEKNSPQRLSTARAGIDAGDLKAVEQAVHSLKSSAGNVGAMALMELAQSVEDAAEKDRQDGLSNLLDHLETELDRVLQALDNARREMVA